MAKMYVAHPTLPSPYNHVLVMLAISNLDMDQCSTVYLNVLKILKPMHKMFVNVISTLLCLLLIIILWISQLKNVFVTLDYLWLDQLLFGYVAHKIVLLLMVLVDVIVLNKLIISMFCLILQELLIFILLTDKLNLHLLVLLLVLQTQQQLQDWIHNVYVISDMFLLIQMEQLLAIVHKTL